MDPTIQHTNASLKAVSPATSSQGQVFDATIQGDLTDFVNGTTTASFGAGVSVNGSASGSAGLVTVTSPTQATAHLVIDLSATPGARDVNVATNAQQESLKSGFAVTFLPVPPVVVLGGQTTGQVGAPVSFSAAASSDPKGEALTYAWTFGDGATATGVTTTHTYASGGPYLVTLKVTNTDNLSTAASETVTISAPPVAVAGGPYSGTAGTAISFSGAASNDPRNEPLTYAWAFGDGSTGAGVAPTHTYAAAGTFMVTLKVTNTDTLSSVATATATVAPAPQAPVASAGGPYTGTAGTAVAFSGSSSTDPKGEALTYSWTFGDGSTGSGVAPTHIYTAAGSYSVTLKVTNTDTLSATATATATIAAGPVPPVANAGGPYSGTAGTALTFSGTSSSDPKGETLTYAWTFGDGGTGSGVSPVHTYAAAGAYAVTLKVTNTDALSSTAAATATIATAAQPPVANPGGPYTGTAGTAITFSGTASSDPKGETLTYAWTFGDGSTGTGVNPSHTYSAAGTYTITLKVTDTDSLTATATATAAIIAAAQAPVANAGGPYAGTAGAAILFSASASSDPRNEALSYAWAFGDGGSGTGLSPTHTYAAAGTYAVTLKVTNTDGLSATATAAATIATAPQAPVGNAGGPYTATVGTAIVFSGAASSDPKNETLSYTWTFGDGGTGTGVAPAHTYAAAGTFLATLTVRNTDNLSATATAAVTIAAAQAPVASAGGPYKGTAGTTITFSGAGSSDPKSEALSYAWSFGDGTTGAGVAPTHSYTTGGTYTVSLTVTNTDNLSGTATTIATITAAAQAPVANAGGPYAGTAGAAIAFSGTASTDPKNEMLSYAWNFGDGSTGSGAAPGHTYVASGSYTVTLTVTNTDQLSSVASTTATVTAAQMAPVANAGGPYAGSLGAAVTFSGAGSTDPRNEALTYAWNFGDNTTASQVSPTHTYAAAGRYTVTLTVTNTDQLSSSATTTATIASSGSQSPVANAGGPYTAKTGVAIAFNGSASTDPKGEGLTYSWSFGDGATATGAMPTHSYVAAGSFTVSLTVTNTDGANATASASASITAPNAVPPVVNANGPYTGQTGDQILFSASGSYDPTNASAGPSGLTLVWDFGDGSQTSGPAPIHSYSKAGTYTVALTGTAAGGTTASASGTATITAGPAADPATPKAVPGGPYAGKAGSPVSFNGGGSSDPKNASLTYSWDFGDGTGTTTGAQLQHTYVSGGTYSVVLTVYNGSFVNSASTTAVIAAGPAAAGITANAGGPYTVAANQNFRLNGSKSANPATGTLLYTWDFGDGVQGSGPMPIHVYLQKGTYAVSLTVFDGQSLSANATTSVTVTAPPAEAVVANAGGPYTGVTGQSIPLDGSGTTDNVGATPTFSWDFGDGSSGSGSAPGHVYAAAGTYTATVTASSGGSTSTATAQVIVAQAVLVTITSPAQSALLNTNTTTVTGTLSNAGMTVGVNGVAATVNGTNFTAAGVQLREGVNLITATASGPNNSVGNGTVSVILDATAPGVSIVTPAANAMLTTSQIAVSGLVNDIVTGTIGSNNVTVTVNGIAAQVSNRSYLLPSLTLVPGTNTITVVATDQVGNHTQISETVQLLPANSQITITKVSGDSQTGAVHSVLSQPLVVQLQSSTGAPIVGRPITFAVTRSDGVVEVLPNQGQSLAVTTDATGKANVLLQLGSRTGLGVTQVTASSPGASASAVFLENSTTGTPALIKAVRGERQRGLLGESLAEAFQVQVQDAYGNPVQGTTVNFTSVAGGGTLDNAAPQTDSNGKASATLTLGQMEGVNNYAVTADFLGDPAGRPITFIASGFAAGPVAATSVSGVVLDSSNSPVPNATVRIANTNLQTVTNTSGNFSIGGAPVGTITLSVDGSTSTSTQTLPFLSFVVEDLPGQNNTLGKPIYLPSIDVNDAQTVGGDDAVTLTMAGVPGVAFTVAPHSVTFPDGTTVGKLSLSQVKADQVPMEPVNNSGPDLIWTLQPAGTRFSVPVQVTLPNTQGLAPGTVEEFYQYDHDLEQFVSAGTAHVSADGSVMVSDPGFGISKAGWGEGPVVPLPNTCVMTCQSKDPCVNLGNVNCNCVVTGYNYGAVCGDQPVNVTTTYLGVSVTAPIQMGCTNPGHCTANGVCDQGYVPAGTDCKTNDVCYSGVCSGTGTCLLTNHVGDVDNTAFAGGNLATSFGGTVSLFAKKVQTLIEGFTPKDKVFFNINPQGGTSADIIHCCEETQTLGTHITDYTAGFQATIQGSQLPILTPTGIELGVPLPDGEVFGFYVQFGGQFTLAGTDHVDGCVVTNTCKKATIGFGITAALGFNVPTPVVSFNLNGATGFAFNATPGCGQLAYSLGITPIVVTGQLKLFNYGTIQETYTYDPHLSYSSSFAVN